MEAITTEVEQGEEACPAPVKIVPEPSSSVEKKGKERGPEAMGQETGMRRQTVYEKS
jgi:hypothetical protein